MPALPREQENQPDILNWFISINGALTDAYSVQYRILDITGGLPGSQVFPAVSGDYEDVTTGAGHFSTGSYYAYDNANAEGWTPGVGEPLGTHRIEWRWKASAASPYQAGFEDFEVLPSSVGASADLYINLSDVRGAGIDSTIADDATVLASIELWQSMIERVTRQWFNPRTMVIKFDGTDSAMLPLGVPIISVDYLKLNNDPVALDPNYYRVYSSRGIPDDRRNPRIMLIGAYDDVDIYTAPIVNGILKFRKGRQNQELKGTFGFVEENGGPPPLIKRALLKLVVEKLTNPIYVPAGVTPPAPPPALISGFIQQEITDGHQRSYEMNRWTVNPRRPNSLMGFTNDPEIIEAIKLYRGPIGIATPAHPSHTSW